jgi:hypothetical protein
MTEGCEAVTEAKQITVVAERKPVRAVSGSSCVVIRSSQVGTDASRGRPAVPLLALLGAALEGPSPACSSAVTTGVDFERADLLEPAGDGSNLASRISCSGQVPGAVLNPVQVGWPPAVGRSGHTSPIG